MSGFVFNEKPINIESGEGAYLYGSDGTEYLDFGASYAVAALGHAHPAVTDAVQKQAEKLTYVQASYPVDVRTELYEKLAAVAPDGLENVWLCNSGTEANEAAMKFARSATDRSKIIATKRGFHGRTMGALAMTWKDKYKKPFEPLAGDVEFVTYGDEAELAEAIDEETAAVFLEPVQGEGGIHPAGTEYLQTARKLTEEAGAALAFDEIQTGIGRTGTLWACEGAGVTPDILTSAKGIANGLPLGATLVADWIAENPGNHGSTFSGGPVVCAAANATLDTIVEEDYPSHAAAVGEYLKAELEAAAEEHDLPVRDVRGQGLMLGVQVKRGANRVLKNLAISEQVLALPAGRTVVRLLPPLVVTEGHADEFVESFVEVTK
ncbi:acetylornithine aminotransferase [Halogeometricum borinquense DSM 11551]|uniref:Putative [LysW]-aminoadipate semialdehyde/glutamate semialdehyde transaminase n=1 Tax=Halogeometricum borinquense (strain ATCC 700274 / DSM 11551 / JCM 10706 / KCTC 4070 / PR3) TaxID=469382 RepID=E4NSA2_HALBP|nr:acetylornithine/succinylornithine family transaminase [Halogeometricum borinquense]ADQ65787.1 acetylornithine aminotransferase apoenzyme; N2-acetyl-L-lysine aminotransferase apoenzyme [Halogeometricum borinquense DSM 11551]ELY26790.1 acetylornithine aminotransferase [Halogeometricum borinquense DSM 11551]